MTAMLDRPAPAAGLPAPQTTPSKRRPRRPRKQKPWSSFYDEEVVSRVVARAKGRYTRPIRKLTDEEKVAVARYYIERGHGPTRIATALRTNGTIARRLAETVRLDQVLDEVETWL